MKNIQDMSKPNRRRSKSKLKKRVRYRVRFLAFIVLAATFIFIYKNGISTTQGIDVQDQIIKPAIAMFDDNDISDAFPTTDAKETFHKVNNDFSNDLLNSPNAILVCLSDSNILLEKRGSEKIYPASLTKIMTAIVALENLSDLQETILLPEKIFPDLYEQNASMAGFWPGEKVTAIDLLYGTLLPSGAECSVGLALGISGSEKKFVKLMNEKAKKIGMEDTHFVNVSGLHNKNHYTTVKDISLLLEYALQNESFREMFTSSSHSTSATDLHPDGITFYSTLFKKMDAPDFNGGEILGGKTGYTDKAGLCLASLAKKNGEEYILVTAGASGSPYSEQTNILDAITVYDKFLLQ